METTTKQFGHIQKEERSEIFILLKKGYSYRRIAEALARNHSSISREIKNNSVNGIYDPFKANHKAYVNRHESKYQGMKIRNEPVLEKYIQDKLQIDKLSPEQIAGRIKNIDTQIPYVSYLGIYKYLYSELGQSFCQYLQSHRYRKRQRKTKKTSRDMIFNRISIDLRPQIATERKEFGHFEGDTIVSAKRHHSKAALSVQLERKARYVGIRRIMDLKPITNNNAIKSMSANLKVFKSLTLDNGIENKEQQQLSKDLNINIYFCNPYSSWQKGGVENINRWIRRFIPKGSNIADFSEEFVAFVETKLNNTPRKCLNFKTPLEVMIENNLLYPNQKINPSGAIEG